MPKCKPPRKKKAAKKKADPVSVIPLSDRQGLESLLANLGGLSDLEDDLSRAQELVYSAYDEIDDKKRVRLAKQALKICPQCADAYVLLAEQYDPGSRKALELYRQAVEAGEAALGPKTFEEDVGFFWEIIETRPYMRARAGLAQTLLAHDQVEEAVNHFEDMLRLNPNDNQGIRYELTTWYILQDRDAKLSELLEAYHEDCSAAWTYTKALAAFRADGGTDWSHTLLQEAFASNHHVPDFLLGLRKLPDEFPLYMTMGGEDEAIYFLIGQSPGWLKVPGALEWMKACFEAQESAPRAADNP